MKIREINKYQAGGYITYQPLPTIPQQQQPVEAPADSGRSSKSEEDDGALNKELMGKLLGEGLTNDVMQYSQYVNQAYYQYARMTDLDKNTYKGRQLRLIMKGDLGQLNALVRGKKDLEDAVKTAQDNNALNELAVTPHGIVVKDDQGKINVISFTEYAKDNASQSRHYRPLTNAELAQAREYDNQLTGNNNVYSIISYANGMDKIKDEVFKIANTITASSKSVSDGGYGGDTDAADIAALQSAASNGLFKIKDGSTHTSNSEQIAKAKRILWATLKDSSRATLLARAATMVQDPADVQKKAIELAASLLDPHEYSVDREVHDLNAKRGLKGGNGNDPKAQFGPTEAAFSGRSNHDYLNTIGPEGTKIDGHMYAIPTFNYTDNQNQRTTLQNTGKLDQIARTDQAFTANGDPVNRMNTVVTGGAYYTTLPVKVNDNGVMQIDREGAKKYAQAMDAFNKLPASERLNPDNTVNKLKESEMLTKYGANNLNLRKLVVAEAMSYADKFFDDRDPKYYEKVNDKAMKQYVGDIVDPNQKTVRSWLDNSVYKHLVFMPARDELSARAADGHEASVPASVFDMRTFNTGTNGANISDGQPMDSSVNPSSTPYTADYWNK